MTKEATTESAGIRTYTCEKCGDSYTEEIAKLPAKPEPTKVEKVNTMNNDGKKKRVRGTYNFGKTAKTKKAIVKLTEDSADIEIFQGL